MRQCGVAAIWGPPRSGTTWLFNVVKAMLDRAQVPTATWVSGQRPRVPLNYRSLVMKSHQAELADVLLSAPSLEHVYPLAILRDAEPTFQSLVRTQTETRRTLLDWLDRDLDSIATALEDIPSARVVRLEWIATRATTVITQLTDYLDITLTTNDVNEIAETFEREAVRHLITSMAQKHEWTGSFDEFDIESQWHATHIAPENHIGVKLTNTEERKLSEFQKLIDTLTERYSLMTPERDSMSVQEPARRECVQSTSEFVVRHLEQQFRGQTWNRRLSFLRRQSVSR